MNTPQIWRLKGQRLRLEGSECTICGYKSFPPRPSCPHCTACREAHPVLDGYRLDLLIEEVTEPALVEPAYNPGD